jgi:hypothetical protein
MPGLHRACSLRAALNRLSGISIANLPINPRLPQTYIDRQVDSVSSRFRTLDRTYGQKEGVAELIPFMFEAFLNADHGFKRARNQLENTSASAGPTQTKDV